MWQNARCKLHRPQPRLDADGFKSKARRSNAKDAREEMVERMRAPRVAIAAAGLRHFGRRLETLARQIKPQLHAVKHPIGAIQHAIGFEQIMVEIDRRSKKMRIVKKAFSDRARINFAAKNRQ